MFPEKNFGTVRLSAPGDHAVRLTVVGKRAAARSYGISADRFALVADSRAPTIMIPGDLTVEATGPDGAVATFAATATDDKDGAVPVTLAPPSGSTFPLGATVVTATASDFHGNKASKTFTVTVEDTTAPSLIFPADLTLEATGPQGAVATYAGTAYDLVSGDVAVVFTPPSGTVFPLGDTPVTATATDDAENSVSGTFTVTVRDTTPPAIVSLAASPDVLWPPNHKMVPVTLAAQVSDLVDASPVTRIVSVSSNEADDGKGDGNTSGDWQITGPLSLDLRAERAGAGGGRIYLITVESRDRFGNASARAVTVAVPHDGN